jgi:trehalose/maltose transport system substrate-binding protein
LSQAHRKHSIRKTWRKNGQHSRNSGLKKMKIRSTVGILLFSIGMACSRQQPAHEPVTLTFLDIEWEAPDQLPQLAEDLQDFTKKTGIQVKRLPGPDSPHGRLALWRESLEKGDGTPDVCSIDVIWSGILSPFLMDLKPYFAADVSSQHPVVVASYTVGDKLVAVPHHAYVGAMIYRSDLLGRYGYREPPKTWEEMETMASRIQAGERARGQKHFWGFVWQGAAAEDLTCAGLEWQKGDGGGRIIEDDRTISVSNPRAIRAWQRAARWVGSISPPGVTAYAKWDAENTWRSGNAAFLRGWVSDYSLINLHIPPRNSTRYGVSSLPGGAAGRADTLGGDGLAVSRTSTHPHEALELVRFLRRKDAQLMSASRHSEPPKELELFELPDILEPYPNASKFRQNGGSVVARPSVVACDKYEDVSRAYARAVHSVLTGETLSSAAVAALEKELVEITGFRCGLPKRDW